MRVKELNNKVAHIAFAPGSIYPCYLASATAAEQVDSSSSVKTTLDLLKLDLSSPNPELEVAASVPIESRFNKLLWSDYSSATSKNVIIGGSENSRIHIFDYERIISSPNASCVTTLEQHSPGGVFSLDINPFQHNLLASGGNESEILVWDLNSPQKPMTPGAKLQPLEAVTCLAWNNQVQHILASTAAGGKCVVWDLRKNESIIKVSDAMSKMRSKIVSWNPDVATQMCLASDDDHTPQLQIWDLRFATAPVRLLEGHQRGVLAFSWYTNDSNLLISSSKDNRVVCWNPNNPTVNGEILFDLPTPGQWCFDLSWCKRYPNLIASASLEGQVNVYSLMGGRFNVAQPTSSKIMDSFGVDSLANIPESPTAKNAPQFVDQLKIAPKWMKRACGATFGFGGKLVSFGRFQAAPVDGHHQGEHAPPTTTHDAAQSSRVTIQQVVTDTKLVENSHFLENALQTGNFNEYCNYKIESTAGDNAQSSIWRYIQATFDPNKKEKFLELLGFNQDELNGKLKTVLKEIHADRIDSVSKTLNSSLNLNGTGLQQSSNVFDQIQNAASDNIQDDVDDTFNDIARSMSPVNLNFKNDIDNLITELLLLGRYEDVVDLCIQEERYMDAALIGNFFDKNLLLKAQKAYFRHQNKNKFANFLEKFLNRNWQTIISQCNMNDWKEALASVITYTQGEEQSQLLDTLGARLEANNQLVNACICYICSSNLDALVQCWPRVIGTGESGESVSASLQDLIEKAMILRAQLLMQQRQVSLARLNNRLIEYAKLLADQGCFLNAYTYLKDSNDASLSLIKDRVFHCLDPAVVQQYRLAKPENPFRANTQASSNVHQYGAANTGLSSTQQARKIGYGQPTPVAQVQQPTYGVLGSNPTANALNTPFLPVNSVNHPMPTSTLYGAQQQQIQSVMKPPSVMQTQASTVQPSIAPSVSNTMINQNVNPNPASFFTPQNQTNIAPQQPPVAPIPSYMHAKPAAGWNDPPMVSQKVKPVQPIKEATEMPTFFQPSMPTGHNPGIYGGVPNQNQFYQQPGGMMNQPVVPNTFNPSMQPAQGQLYMPQAQQPAPIQRAPEPEKPATPVPKAPIPAEHQIISSVLDSLLTKCHNSTNVPTVKRKLDDVGKKLELLYDKLRDSSLSPSVVQGLHTMIQYIQAFDYQSALVLHSNLVATSNFTEISGFMPGVKVLIQSCQQMNVTL